METIRTSCYGICLYSVLHLKSYMKEIGKVRLKKILPYFQKNHDIYLQSLSEGVWIPIVKINSVEYVIKVSNSFEDFDEDWVEVYSYKDFYLRIGSDNSVWIASIGKLLDFNEKEYLNSTDGLLSYNTLDGETINSAVKYNIEEGYYSVTIKGYKRKDHQKRGFLFTFDKVLSPLEYKDPRCDELYHFNLINQ